MQRRDFRVSTLGWTPEMLPGLDHTAGEEAERTRTGTATAQAADTRKDGQQGIQRRETRTASSGLHRTLGVQTGTGRVTRNFAQDIPDPEAEPCWGTREELELSKAQAFPDGDRNRPVKMLAKMSLTGRFASSWPKSNPRPRVLAVRSQPALQLHGPREESM